jgi:hypothetical protein
MTHQPSHYRICPLVYQLPGKFYRLVLWSWVCGVHVRIVEGAEQDEGCGFEGGGSGE